jgi:hypothetical protein
MHLKLEISNPEGIEVTGRTSPSYPQGLSPTNGQLVYGGQE